MTLAEWRDEVRDWDVLIEMCRSKPIKKGIN